MLSFLLISLLIILILLYTKDIKDLEVSTIMKKSEVVGMTISIGIVLIITLSLAEVWLHYLIGILGILVISLEFNRRGITKKGVIVAAELNIFGYWKNLKSVEITQNDSDTVKIVITRKFPLVDEAHYYDSKYYERILAIILKHLPEEKVKIREQV